MAVLRDGGWGMGEGRHGGAHHRLHSGGESGRGGEHRPIRSVGQRGFAPAAGDEGKRP